MNLYLRKARIDDKDEVLIVESKSTPSLRYLSYVYDEWIKEYDGDLSIVELDGKIIGVGKYSRLPDSSAWLEALRVIPERQGIGAGKRLYEHWFKLAHEQNVKNMRMYTNLSNVKSKGLAERFGLRIEGTYREAILQLDDYKHTQPSTVFQRIKDPDRAIKLIMKHNEKWGGFLIMNRTFYRLNPLTCAYLSNQGMVYENIETNSVIILGARFMPWQSLHVGFISGDYVSCLRFSHQIGEEHGVERLSILYPSMATDVEDNLKQYGFKVTQGDFITMGIDL